MRRRWLWAGAAAIGLAVAAAWLVSTVAPTERSGPTARVERRPFVRTVVAQGVLEAVKSTPIVVPPNVGRQTRVEWIAEDGARVGVGDVVLRLDPTEFASELEEGLADRYASGERIAKALATLAATLEQLGLDARVAWEEHEVAQAFQLLDEEVFSRFELIESALDVELIEARLEYTEAVRVLREELSEADLELLRLDRERSDRRVEDARRGLEAIEITAPHDGIFLLQRHGWRQEVLRVGSTVSPGIPVASLPELTEMQARVHVLEADAGGLAPGQPARIALEAVPGRAWQARVLRVEPVARPWLVGSPVQYFGVTLELESTDRQIMKPGQRLEAEIEVRRLPEAVVVPRAALFFAEERQRSEPSDGAAPEALEQQGATVVYRRFGSRVEMVPVRVVSPGHGWVAVEGELEAGDTVLLEDPTEHARPGAAREREAIAGASSPSGVAAPGGP